MKLAFKPTSTISRKQKTVRAGVVHKPLAGACRLAQLVQTVMRYTTAHARPSTSSIACACWCLGNGDQPLPVPA